MEYSHESDEQLELYALGRLPEARVAAVEEHLLACASCQDRLDQAETFAVSMREAIAGEPAVQPRTDWFAWFRVTGLRQPAMAWVGGFAAIVLATGLYLHSGRSVAPLASLQLTALRGEVQSTTPARETDITLSDAPAEPVLRAEIVDSVGARVWSGALEGVNRKIQLMKQLAPGDYFVRLHDDTGKLLHEYGFRVRKVI